MPAALGRIFRGNVHGTNRLSYNAPIYWVVVEVEDVETARRLIYRTECGETEARCPAEDRRIGAAMREYRKVVPIRAMDHVTRSVSLQSVRLGTVCVVICLQRRCVKLERPTFATEKTCVAMVSV